MNVGNMMPAYLMEHSITVQTALSNSFSTLVIVSRMSQIITSTKLKSTGSLSFVTTMLTVLGNVSRVTTVYFEAGNDYKYLGSIAVNFALNAYILFQFWLYRKNSLPAGKRKELWVCILIIRKPKSLSIMLVPFVFLGVQGRVHVVMPIELMTLMILVKFRHVAWSSCAQTLLRRFVYEAVCGFICAQNFFYGGFFLHSFFLLVIMTLIHVSWVKFSSGGDRGQVLFIRRWLGFSMAHNVSVGRAIVIHFIRLIISDSRGRPLNRTFIFLMGLIDWTTFFIDFFDSFVNQLPVLFQI